MIWWRKVIHQSVKKEEFEELAKSVKIACKAWANSEECLKEADDQLLDQLMYQMNTRKQIYRYLLRVTKKHYDEGRTM